MQAPVGQLAQNSTPSTLGSTTEVARLSKKKRRRVRVPTQRVSPVTVPNITFPTLSDDTNNWIRVAQTAAYTQQERARLGTILILGPHLRRICQHGDDETE